VLIIEGQPDPKHRPVASVNARVKYETLPEGDAPPDGGATPASMQCRSRRTARTI